MAFNSGFAVTLPTKAPTGAAATGNVLHGAVFASLLEGVASPAPLRSQPPQTSSALIQTLQPQAASTLAASFLATGARATSPSIAQAFMMPGKTPQATAAKTEQAGGQPELGANLQTGLGVTTQDVAATVQNTAQETGRQEAVPPLGNMQGPGKLPSLALPSIAFEVRQQGQDNAVQAPHHSKRAETAAAKLAAADTVPSIEQQALVLAQLAIQPASIAAQPSPSIQKPASVGFAAAGLAGELAAAGPAPASLDAENAAAPEPAPLTAAAPAVAKTAAPIARKSLPIGAAGFAGTPATPPASPGASFSTSPLNAASVPLAASAPSTASSARPAVQPRMAGGAAGQVAQALTAPPSEPVSGPVSAPTPMVNVLTPAPLPAQTAQRDAANPSARSDPGLVRAAPETSFALSADPAPQRSQTQTQTETQGVLQAGQAALAAQPGVTAGLQSSVPPSAPNFGRQIPVDARVGQVASAATGQGEPAQPAPSGSAAPQPLSPPVQQQATPGASTAAPLFVVQAGSVQPAATPPAAPKPAATAPMAALRTARSAAQNGSARSDGGTVTDAAATQLPPRSLLQHADSAKVPGALSDAGAQPSQAAPAPSLPTVSQAATVRVPAASTPHVAAKPASDAASAGMASPSGMAPSAPADVAVAVEHSSPQTSPGAAEAGAARMGAASTAVLAAPPANQAHAATPATATPSSVPSPPAAQLASAAAALHVGPNGTSHVTVRLAPAELGQVEIRISRAQDGTSSVSVAVERPETLATLQNDLGHLHQALDRAGVGDQRTVSMHLAPPSDSPGNPSLDTGAGFTSQGGSQQGARQDRQPSSGAPSYTGDTPAAATAPAPSRPRGGQETGVNITA